jgi:hypothetical protein
LSTDTHNPASQVRVSSRSASSAGIALGTALLGFVLTIPLFFAREPLMFFTAVFSSGSVWVITAALLSRWYQKYARRRSKKGALARGQALAVLAFGAWCLQLALIVTRTFLSIAKWQGF